MINHETAALDCTAIVLRDSNRRTLKSPDSLLRRITATVTTYCLDDPTATALDAELIRSRVIIALSLR